VSIYTYIPLLSACGMKAKKFKRTYIRSAGSQNPVFIPVIILHWTCNIPTVHYKFFIEIKYAAEILQIIDIIMQDHDRMQNL
jgi:hypothetical protein